MSIMTEAWSTRVYRDVVQREEVNCSLVKTGW